MCTKIKSKHEHPIILIQTNKMLHFLPNYFFSALKNDTENTSETRHHVGLHGQAKNMQCYSGVTFSGIHINKMHRDKPSKKKTEITSHSHATRGFCTSQGRYKRHIIVDFGITYTPENCNDHSTPLTREIFIANFIAALIATFDENCLKPNRGKGL